MAVQTVMLEHVAQIIRTPLNCVRGGTMVQIAHTPIISLVNAADVEQEQGAALVPQLLLWSLSMCLACYELN
jgi:hypothetical protein